MAKVRYHLAPHGPDICRADPSNPRSKGCPFGGDSGSENHFDTMAEAESAYGRQMEADGNGLVAPATTAATAGARETALGTELKQRFRKSFDSLVADSYYGISGNANSGFVADSTESLERLRDAFTESVDDEAYAETIYEDDCDDAVIRSIYIEELDIEIENQNSDEDRDEYFQALDDRRYENRLYEMG